LTSLKFPRVNFDTHALACPRKPTSTSADTLHPPPVSPKFDSKEPASIWRRSWPRSMHLDSMRITFFNQILLGSILGSLLSSRHHRHLTTEYSTQHANPMHGVRKADFTPLSRSVPHSSSCSRFHVGRPLHPSLRGSRKPITFARRCRKYAMVETFTSVRCCDESAYATICVRIAPALQEPVGEERLRQKFCPFWRIFSWMVFSRRDPSMGA
jgi:hypothetical protein